MGCMGRDREGRETSHDNNGRSRGYCEVLYICILISSCMKLLITPAASILVSQDPSDSCLYKIASPLQQQYTYAYGMAYDNM